MGQAREYLLGCFREEDAAGGLLGLHQLLHQHPVQRREQPLRHSRLLFFLRSKQKRSKLPRSPWPHHHHPQPLGGFRVLWLNASAAEITDLPLGDRAPRRRNVLRPLRCRLERFFFIFIFKKTKFQKYMSNSEIFKNGCLSPRVPVAHWMGDMT